MVKGDFYTRIRLIRRITRIDFSGFRIVFLPKIRKLLSPGDNSPAFVASHSMPSNSEIFSHALLRAS